jgi:hypothetical protein
MMVPVAEAVSEVRVISGVTVHDVALDVLFQHDELVVAAEEHDLCGTVEQIILDRLPWRVDVASELYAPSLCVGLLLRVTRSIGLWLIWGGFPCTADKHEHKS